MSRNFSRILTILVAVLSVIGIALFINVSMNEEGTAEMAGAVSPLVEYTAFILYAAIAVTMVLSVLGLFKNPENLKKTLLGIGVLAVLLIVSYTIADSNAVLDSQGAILKDGGQEGSSTNQWVGTLIWLSTVLLLIGGFMFIYDMIKNLVKS